LTDYLAILDLASGGGSGHSVDLEAPLAAVSHDCMHQWRDANFAVAQATLHVTPESLHETLPLASPAGHVIAGDIRLDNRGELFEALGIPHTERAALGDGALVLAAYARWGADCAEHLLGDFAYAIWDAPARRLVCSTDGYGVRRFHYRLDGKRFLLASRQRVMLAVPGVPLAPNLSKLDWIADIRAFAWPSDESYYAGIHTAPGATTLVIDGEGRLTQRTYWEPQTGTQLRFRSDGEFREAFQHLFFESVRSRLRSSGPVTAMLSGGLDSSSVVAVAASILAQDNRQLDVLSVVLPDPRDPVLKDEREYIDLFRAFPNVRINYIHPEGKGPFSDLDTLDLDIGPLQTSRHYNYSAMARRCAELGSRVLLDGGHGELGATAHVQGYLAELFFGLRWPTLWREMRATQALTGASVLAQLRQNVIKPILPQPLVRLLADRRNVNLGGMGVASPAFEAEARRRIAAAPPQPFRLDPGASHRAFQLELMKFRRVRGTGIIIPPGPLEYRYPFMDRRLMQFCLDAPGSYKLRDGRTRSIARIGLEGILPREIQLRTTKTGFSPDYMRRYNRQAAEAVYFLESVGPNDPVRQLIDIEKVLGYARTPMRDDEPDALKEQDATHRVPLAIYTILFLRKFAEFRV
jgi:asparagine synthase (glutamine-hydrolysing)